MGEDVTYEAESHDGVPADLDLAGTWTFADLSARLDGFEELAEGFRRWAFESAALDLALRQNGLGLGEALGRPERPVRFVVSPAPEPESWLAAAPDLEFKLDAETDWDRDLLRRFRALDRVRVVDLKAYYRGTSVDFDPDPELYRAIAEELPDVVIEDAWLEDGCLEALAGAEDRLSFDAPVHSLADLNGLTVSPQWLNIKPSALRHRARATRDDRGGGGAWDPDVRRRPVRARPGPAPHPATRERLLSRRPERRCSVGVQRGRPA